MRRVERAVPVVGILLAVAAIVLAIIALTQSSSQSTASSKVRLAVPSVQQQHPCTPANYYMQCAANAPGQVPTLSPQLSPFSRFGIDFAWGGPSGITARSRGAGFACSYLSLSSKDWTYSNLHSYVSAGLGACLVWEVSAARSLLGFNQGYRDAASAHFEETRLGFPRAHVYFASDFDTSVYGTRFLPYYQGANAYARAHGFTVGAYGGLHTVAVVCAAGMKPNWQTLAWSYGVWASTSCAPLRQTSINDNWYGSSVDYDLAVASDYGQVNFVAPKPPGPTKKQVSSWTKARDASLRAYHARRCTQPVLGRKDCYLFYQRVVYFQTQINKAQPHPRCFGRHASISAPVCQVIRPAVAAWSRARASSQRVAIHAQKHHQPATTFRKRARYFDQKATSTVKAWA